MKPKGPAGGGWAALACAPADGDTLDARVRCDGEGAAITVEGAAAADDAIAVDADGAIYVLRAGRQTLVRLKDFEAIDVEHLDTGGVIAAPMHGKVLAVLVEPGAAVAKGQRVAVIEAMKMEHALTTPIAGTVAEISAVPGSQIAEGAAVMVIAPNEGS